MCKKHANFVKLNYFFYFFIKAHEQINKINHTDTPAEK
jgi:hypothetical protein